MFFFFFSSRRRHTRLQGDWSSDVCSSDLLAGHRHTDWGVRTMKSVEPEIFLVSRPRLDYEAIARYLREVGGEGWLERLDRGTLDGALDNDAQNLAEFAGKLC